MEGYRDAYPAIAGTKFRTGSKTREGGLWNDLEVAAFNTIQCRTINSVGRCEFSMVGSTLVVRLPSGRRLSYQKARIETRIPGRPANGHPPTTKPTIVYDGPTESGIETYGGALTENIIQAICRDLLADAMLRCERAGLPIVLHVHDEIVLEVLAEVGDTALRRLLTIMSTPPVWAAGFPLEVEGFAAERYFKKAPQGATVLRARNGLILSA